MATESGNHGDYHYWVTPAPDTIDTAPALVTPITDVTPPPADLTTLDASGQEVYIMFDEGSTIFDAHTEDDGSRAFHLQMRAPGHDWDLQWHVGDDEPVLTRDGAPVDFTFNDWLP